MKKIFCILFLLGAIFQLSARKAETASFAVVVDMQSYREAKEELDAYMQSIKQDGLNPLLLKGTWRNPDSLRQILKKLYLDKRQALEGAVFIGDIPVAMIRKAQHLTSAFKMDEEHYPWQRSSVPSDRFYDDFDLAFDFIKQDSIHKNLFYYELRPDSEQRLKPEIYSGRIKPFEGKNKYQDLRKYFKKLLRVRAENRKLSRLFYFGGSGYNSESVTARMDEKISFFEQFPSFKTRQNSIRYLYHNRSERVKDLLLCELQDEQSDLALLHHHGSSTAQYISGLPQVSAPERQLNAIKQHLRSKLRESKDTAATVRRFMQQYQLPRSWFEGAFDLEQQRKDSLFNAGLEIVIADIRQIRTNIPVIILDACYNGAFQLDRYLAGAYIFNEGNTVAVQANSVNVLQDKWTNEFLGLLGLGLRIGQWSRLNSYLESHIIGDPAFRFAAVHPTPFDINRILNQSTSNTAFWKKQSRSPLPELQALSWRKLFEREGTKLSQDLLAEFQSNPQGTVRMECLRLLTACNDANFLRALKLAADDSYELVRRQAAYLMGKSGNPQVTQSLLRIASDNNPGKRVAYCADEALAFFPEKELTEAFDLLSEGKASCLRYDRQQLIDKTERWKRLVSSISQAGSGTKQRRSDIRTLRNYNIHQMLPELCKMLLSEKEELSIRLALVEALGWFNISYRKAEIIETCEQLLRQKQLPEALRKETRRSLRRLNTAWYR